MAQYLEPGLVRVVHQEQRHLVIAREVSGAYVLLVSGKVCKGQGLSVNYLKEALWSAAMLHVRPPVFSLRRDIEGVTLTDELYLVGAESVVVQARLRHPLILAARSVTLLQVLDGVGEHDF